MKQQSGVGWLVGWLVGSETAEWCVVFGYILAVAGLVQCWWAEEGGNPAVVHDDDLYEPLQLDGTKLAV